MRSTDLPQDGFMNWFPLNLNQQHRLLNRTPTKRGAFAVRSLQDYPRVRGQSDIYSLGVGANSIKGLYTRVEQMFSPGRSQTTNNNILDEMRTRLLEISFEKTNANNAKALVSTILNRFELDHGELPPVVLHHH